MATLVSQWLFDNAYTDSNSGTNDLVANGTGNSFVTSPKAKGTHSLQLDGNGGALKNSGGTGWNTGNVDVSFGGWLYHTTSVGGAVILEYGSGSNGQTWAGYTQSSSQFTLENLAVESQTWTVSISANTFNWYWLEYTAGTKVCVLYLDNVSQGSKTFVGASINIQAGKCTVGEAFGGALGLVGNVDDTRLYNGVTSAAERDTIYGAAVARGLTLNSRMW